MRQARWSPFAHPGRPGTGAMAGLWLGEMSSVARTGFWSRKVNMEFVSLRVNARPAGA
jgi:hypothetical protein